MIQTLTDRSTSTYENVLTVGQPLTSVFGSSFTCTVTNVLGSDTSNSVEITGIMFVCLYKVDYCVILMFQNGIDTG